MAHYLVRRAVRKALRTLHPQLPILAEDAGLRVRAALNRSGWRWGLGPRCPARRLDAGSAQIGARLYVFSGYFSGDEVLSAVDVLDLESLRWLESFPTPERMAHSHLALIGDGRKFVYVVSGQWGNQCRPATRAAFSCDVETRTWTELPPLPEARYAATAQLWRGRLHVVGGSKEDRHTPATDHWSLAVQEGRAQESEWRVEPAIPRGGPHRASAICDDALWVFGGQEGDYAPVAGDPCYRCDNRRVLEKHFPDVYALKSPDGAWERKADLCLAVSHTEFSVAPFGHRVALFGGQHDRDPKTGRMTLTDAIQIFDTRANRCAVVGRLPYRVKTNLIGAHGGRVASLGGQRDSGIFNPRPGEIVAHTWISPLPYQARSL